EPCGGADEQRTYVVATGEHAPERGGDLGVGRGRHAARGFELVRGCDGGADAVIQHRADLRFEPGGYDAQLSPRVLDTAVVVAADAKGGVEPAADEEQHRVDRERLVCGGGREPERGFQRLRRPRG